MNKIYARHIIASIPEGKDDNDPELLLALEYQFNRNFDRYKAQLFIPGEDLALMLLMTPEQANEYGKEKFPSLTVPTMAEMRNDFINSQIKTIDKDSKEFKELPTLKRLKALQYLAFLETKKDENSDYIIPIDKIKALHDLNDKYNYWDKEDFSEWLKRFDLRVNKCSKLKCNDKEAFHTMLTEVCNIGKVKNKLKDFVNPKFHYSKYNQETKYYQRSKFPEIVAILS